MVTLTIDGQRVEASEGSTILDVARDHNINIPTLCHNDAIAPYGACRLCMVEISKNGRNKLVASCLYPVEDGLEVETQSERVMNSRKVMMEFLLARCPDVKIIQELAREMGVEDTPFEKEDSDCILCSMCVRVCAEVVGVSAIGFIGRGVDRKVGTPFLESPEVCVGCGSCAEICPTEAIKIEDKGNIRTIHNWKVQFELEKCEGCGRLFAPKAQLEYLRKTSGLPQSFFKLCPDCHKS
jgi:NADH dehydrogenase/NADH:ubiquinone oxidoreductase subunit G